MSEGTFWVTREAGARTDNRGDSRKRGNVALVLFAGRRWKPYGTLGEGGRLVGGKNEALRGDRRS